MFIYATEQLIQFAEMFVAAMFLFAGLLIEFLGKGKLEKTFGVIFILSALIAVIYCSLAHWTPVAILYISKP